MRMCISSRYALTSCSSCAERRRRLVQARHRGAQVGDQAAQHGGRLRRSRIDQRLHVRERVEQEMRRDLRLQQMQARIERLALELAALELERERLVARERVLLPHQRGERDPRRDAARRGTVSADEAFAGARVMPERRRAGAVDST